MKLTHTPSGGFSIILEKNERGEKPLQLARVLKETEKAQVALNHVELGEGSFLQIVNTEDDSNLKINEILANTEIIVGDNAHLEFYQMQNVDANKNIEDLFHVEQRADSYFKMVVVSFNGGMIHNEITVDVNGQGASTNVYGLYLLDKKQNVENQLKVNHNVPNCSSDTKFKGILDDEARAKFNGHIFVAPDAQKSNAYQNNSNIILTDKARVNSQPFLEIYADDVKCSHGTSTGQLDKEALFYMRQRGISFENARMLLMYAFAAEISNHIDFAELHDHLDDMIKRRLKGQLSSCDTCVLQCKKLKEEE